MSYTVEEVRGFAPIEDEVSEFLAACVKRGELPASHPSEGYAEIWRLRLDWWWRENPFFREDTLKALVLRDPDGGLVGFHGFIPHDYEKDGTIIPSLIATTFFVHQSHRDAALGVFQKVRQIASTHHVVDGTPTEIMKQILERFRFHSCDVGSQHYFFTRNPGWNPRQIVTTASSVLNRLGKCDQLPGSRLVYDPREVSSIKRRPHDGTIHRRVTLDGLHWATSVGSKKREFVGYVDRNDQLQAYFIGFPQKKYRLRGLRLVDYANFGGASDYLTTLLTELCRHPENSPLAAKTDVFIWTILNAHARPNCLLQRPWGCKVYYKTPREFEGYQRQCLPYEGDGLLV